MSKSLLSTLRGYKIFLAEADEASDVDSMKTGNVTVDQVIEKLNSIRSGKSFKEEQIKNSLSSYMDSLDEAEKVALLAFLKGISQIVTGEIEGQKAVEPSDPAPAVSMEKDVYKRTIKPAIIKKEVEASIEDTTPPAAVTPIKAKVS